MSSAASDLPLLQLVHHARGAHRSSDAQYSEFCARKVARLRQQLDLVQSKGKGKYTKKEVTGSDIRHLTLLLFDVERTWSRSQHIKGQLAAGKVAKRSRQHVLRRLAKAASRAATLVEQARKSTELSASSLAQVEAYALAMKGAHAFEGNKWQVAHDHLAAAHAVLDAVASFAPDADLQAYAFEAQDDASPMLRVCRYNLQLSASTGEPDQFVQGWHSLRERLEKEGATQDKAEPVRVRFRDRTEDVRKPELAKAVRKAQKALESLHANLERASQKAQKRKKSRGPGVSSLASFDAALSALTDAEALAKQSVEDNQIALDKAHSARFESATAPLRFIHAALLSQLLATRCQRDLSLAADARKPAASVKLFDAAIQSLVALANLDMLIEDGDAAEAMEAKAVLARGQRCMHLARAYSSLKQHPKAASLAERATLYARQARPGFMPAEDELDASLRPLALTKEDVDAFEKRSQEVKTTVGKAWFASAPDDESAALDSLNLEGKPRRHKPLFFDIAVNYATHPDLDEMAKRYGQAAPTLVEQVMEVVPEPVKEVLKEAPAPKKGWFGWGR